MNILFISTLTGYFASGPSYSVPARIKALEKIDNVLWINMLDSDMPHWHEVKCYHNIREYKKLRLESLPEPFNNPDVVVFEDFYNIKDVLFAFELKRKRIPYIVVPRSGLTEKAQKHGWLKKQLTMPLFRNFYTRGAVAIQYLTKKESEDSGTKWCGNSFIIPNGFKKCEHVKGKFSEDGIKGIYIGRINKYHKGFDLLVEVIKKIQDELRSAKFTIDVYGNCANGDDISLKNYIESNKLSDIITMHKGVTGLEKQKKLLESDIFIMTSRFEGHPMGLVEAIAYGLPCMVTRGTNMKDEINLYDAGWTCESNIDSITMAFLSIIEEKGFLEKKSANALALSLLYDWDVLAEKFHKKISEYIIK